MAFSFFRTAAFRNLSDAADSSSWIDVRGKDIFLVGENGQGKTNFLEALYFCSYGSSFRGVRDTELACIGEKEFSVSAKLEGSLYREVSIQLRDGKKIISLDGKKINDRKELLEVVPSIVFCHEDMDFVSGTPERRRWFFDQTASLGDALYLEDLRNYRKVLKSRNAVLKEAQGGRNAAPLLDALDPQLVEYGMRLMEKRRDAAEKFSRIFEPLYREISGIDGILVRYAPSWKGENTASVAGELAEKREGDFAFGLSLSGPHRDRFVFTRKGREFSGKASTGQRRLLALLLRTAQARVFSEKTGKNPVLLLDDVLLELDGEKRRNFLSLMPDYEQAFYTFLPGEPHERYRKDGTLVYYVKEGTLGEE